MLRGRYGIGWMIVSWLAIVMVLSLTSLAAFIVAALFPH